MGVATLQRPPNPSNETKRTARKFKIETYMIPTICFDSINNIITI